MKYDLKIFLFIYFLKDENWTSIMIDYRNLRKLAKVKKLWIKFAKLQDFTD